MKIKFTKMHGCGNDYVYVDCMDKMLPNPGKISEFVSRRRFGIGSDGLICICPSDKADFRMRMFNADASEGKMCGNGSRCIAKYVYDKGLTHKDTITLETLGGIKTIHMTVENGKVTMAEVDMGKAITHTKDIPMDWPEATCIDRDVTFTARTGSNSRCGGRPFPWEIPILSFLWMMWIRRRWKQWEKSSNILLCSRSGSMWNLSRWSARITSSSGSGSGAAGKPGPAAPEPVRWAIPVCIWEKQENPMNS